MFIYRNLSIFLLLINIISSIKSSGFNNDFNHMYFKKNSFILYLGTEIVYLKINSTHSTSCDNNVKITYNLNNISFEFIKEEKTYILDDKTNTSYLGDHKILFNNESNVQFIFEFRENKTVEENSDNNSEIHKIYYNESSNIKFYISNGENFFITKIFFSFMLLMCGYFSILYGAYHYMYGVVMHFTLFCYFFIIEFIEIFSDHISDLFVQLYLFFCFLVGLSMSYFLQTENKNNRRYMILKIIHGISFGYSSFKIIQYIYLFYLSGPENEKGRTILYFGLLTFVIITFGVILNLFNPYKKYIFLPCSAVSGYYYLIKGLFYILGGYFSDIVAIKENLCFDFVNNRKELIITYLFLTIFIIIFSIIFQINNIQYKMKEIEIEEEPISRDSNELSRLSNMLDTSNSMRKENEKELIDKSLNNNERGVDDEGDDDNEINDQED